jgi:uncharacterized protein YutE (UPF0331/DUF86 family)
MAIRELSAHDMRIREIAQKYRQMGFKVIIEPSGLQLPGFLRNTGLRPDMIAEGTDESIVVEIKVPGKIHPIEYWEELIKLVQQQPGWRLEMVVGGSSETDALADLPGIQISERLKEAESLAVQGLLGAALLVAWSAVEAAMRIACKKYEVKLPDFRPAALISGLYTDGLIEREDYDVLINIMRVRNSVAHGYNVALDVEAIKILQRIGETLLNS